MRSLGVGASLLAVILVEECYDDWIVEAGELVESAEVEAETPSVADRRSRGAEWDIHAVRVEVEAGGIADSYS